MKQIVLILCAGEESRWQNHLGVPKQLVVIDGEPLIHRTLRQLRERELYDINIITRNPKLLLPDCNSVYPKNNKFILDTFKSTRHLWADKTIVLLGDVWYSEDAINRITAFNQPYGIFGRRSGSIATGCPYREIFAMIFQRMAWPVIEGTLDHSLEKADQEIHHRGKLWSFYRFLVGAKDPFDLPQEDLIFQEVIDYTEDFDSPADYRRWTKNYKAGRVKKIFLTPLNFFRIFVDQRLLQIKRWMFKLGFDSIYYKLIKYCRS